MNSIDIFIQNYFSLARTPFLTEFMYLLTTLFDFSVYSVLITLCITYLVYMVRNFRYAWFFLTTVIFGEIAVYILKLFFNISRPTDGVIYAFGPSFPSYHATVSTIFFVILMYIFDDYLPSTPRILFNTLCASFILLVSFSRIYLGVHWLSDVVAGIVLGVVISYISIVIFKKQKE